ncbi:26S proteasome complex subunit SEM1-like [Uloborus diversus]|uniref:26S proteasome complex subunit SEM1-like n=1 Tax=Uloborus diversus TaxID=327109 RepID=UPI002408F58C|nr:26S proteasome complex subunit SEM1-like [Uloborus diversus]
MNKNVHFSCDFVLHVIILREFKLNVFISFLFRSPADWTAKEEDEQDINVWEDNWDDDNVEDEFSNQLRAELEKCGHRVNGSGEPMKS